MHVNAYPKALILVIAISKIVMPMYLQISRAIIKPSFADAKINAQISCAVTVQFIGAFVFAS